MDTATMLQCARGVAIIEKQLDDVREALRELALKHADVPLARVAARRACAGWNEESRRPTAAFGPSSVTVHRWVKTAARARQTAFPTDDIG